MAMVRALIALTALTAVGSPGAPIGLVGQASADDVVAYRAVTAQFDRAGFDLPPMRVRFHDDEGECRGNRGQVVVEGAEAPTVHVCATSERPHTQIVWRRHTLMHELAHVWVNANTDRSTRRRFMDVREVEVWNDRQAPWGERGIEHSAEVFTWGLLDGDYTLDFRIDRTACVDLAEAFEVLTSRSIRCPAPR